MMEFSFHYHLNSEIEELRFQLKMGFKNGLGYGQGLFFLVLVSMLTVSCMANTYLVGGSEGWKFGFNYTDWSVKLPPLYVKDTLVFKYDPPANSTAIRHNVFWLPDYRSFLECDVKRGKIVANETDGFGNGFHFVLETPYPYFFACGIRDGVHCNVGGMKFAVFPRPPPCNNTQG